MRSWILALSLAGACHTTPDTEDDTDVTLTIDADSFGCISEGVAVRRFYVDNLLGDVDATVAVANDPEGKTWPVGSVVQLVPAEAMVKREAGFSAATDDWEFFALQVTPEGTTITARGAEDATNAFGGNCSTCHAAAAGTWDWICEQDHGCVELPLSEAAVRDLQAADPRCGG